MIGRTTRKCVVYVDGIPIESTLLDAGESGLKGIQKYNPSSVSTQDPRALFEKYDADSSGDIDYDEFKVLLKDLSINLSEPKARAYFKRCDRRRRGCISFDEFRLALYTCDPKHPNRTGGFAPGQSMAPKDLFEMFDRDEEGTIDRDVFGELLDFIGRKMPLDKMEEVFAAYEDPELEAMPYMQFKKAWLAIVDVQAELRLRGERFNKFLPPAMLAKRLAMLVSLEEKQEARTLLEADNALSDEAIILQRRELVKEAQFLARVTLTEALDAAGQVYVFGKGANQRFDSEPREPDFVEFMDYGVVRDLWQQRICPSPDSTTTSTGVTVKNSATGSKGEPTQSKRNHSAVGKRPSPYRMKFEASARAFTNRQVSKATAFLWGKRVNQVACGPAIAYALTDAGEIFCWGGNKRQWRYFYDESTSGSGLASNSGEDSSISANQPEPPVIRHLLTARSEMLKLFALPSQVVENQEKHNQLGLRQKYAKVFGNRVTSTLTDEAKAKRLQTVGQYYGLLKPSTPRQLSLPSLEDLMETVEPDLDVDDLSLSLYIRGVEVAKPIRMILIETVGECLELEIECVGTKFHEHFKQQDQIARRYRRERRERALAFLSFKTTALWFDLAQLREKMINAENERIMKGDEEYDDMKRKITRSTQKLKRQAREGYIDTVGADDNNSPNNNGSHDGEKRAEEALLNIGGLTTRGPSFQFFDGSHALQSIAVGSRHALAIHSSGKLYTWGVGSFGRLGGAQSSSTGDKNGGMGSDSINNNDVSPVDSWHRDVHSAQIIPAVRNVRFRAVSCGFGHSLALSTEGAVYVWGSATHGKLGIGPVPAQESFTVAPIVLSSLIKAGLRVRKIACGPSHSALLTVDGALFVWGCGDGGRLGLGDGRDVGEDRVPRNGGHLSVISVPTRVSGPFGNEKLVEVSCGASHTVVLTALQINSIGQRTGGGCVYVAGSSHALDKFTPQFTRLEIGDLSSVVMIAKVSCGPSHTALVSTEGELYTWGKNVGGSTGHFVDIPVIACPTRVSCMFERPRNLCLDEAATATQSSQNASCLAEYALGGDHAAREVQRRRQTRRSSAGVKLNGAAQTQQEMCPFWQVALAERCRIAAIRIVLTASSFDGIDVTARSMVTTKQRPGSAASESTKYAFLVSEDEFDPDLRGKQSLAKARAHSVNISLSSAKQSELTWMTPADTFGKFVRVQLERNAMLGLQRVEVLGASSEAYVGPRVSDVVCADAMTVAICLPLNNSTELREKFQRAVRSDRANIGILAQLETFHPFVREEEAEAQAGEILYAASLTAKTGIEKREVATAIAAFEAKQRAAVCVLCRPNLPCVVCEIEQQIKAAKLKLSASSSSKSLVDQPQQLHKKKIMTNRSKHVMPLKAPVAAPTSEMAKRPKPTPTLEALCTEFLALDIRSKDEDDAAQKRINLELMDPDELERARQEEEAKARQISGQVAAGPVVLRRTHSFPRILLNLLGLLGQSSKKAAVM